MVNAGHVFRLDIESDIAVSSPPLRWKYFNHNTCTYHVKGLLALRVAIIAASLASIASIEAPKDS